MADLILEQQGKEPPGHKPRSMIEALRPKLQVHLQLICMWALNYVANSLGGIYWNSCLVAHFYIFCLMLCSPHLINHSLPDDRPFSLQMVKWKVCQNLVASPTLAEHYFHHLVIHGVLRFFGVCLCCIWSAQLFMRELIFYYCVHPLFWLLVSFNLRCLTRSRNGTLSVHVLDFLCCWDANCRPVTNFTDFFLEGVQLEMLSIFDQSHKVFNFHLFTRMWNRWTWRSFSKQCGWRLNLYCQGSWTKDVPLRKGLWCNSFTLISCCDWVTVDGS
jgi:hypothetical protein